jgi:hypothetical protein
MRKLITTGALLFAASLIPAALPAQSQSSQPDSQSNGSGMSKPEMTTVTGCVAAGKKEGSYKLTTDDGTTYMLRSKSTNLADHVGHTITVSGRLMTGEKKGGDATSPSNSGDASSAAGSDQNSSGSAAASAAKGNHLMVRSLTMVSESCAAK